MFTLNCKGRLLTATRPLVMGIINVTPDSFYAGSRYSSADAALQQAARMIHEGADILDIGGQSTRPGSEMINVNEEIQRVIPVIERVCQTFPQVIISADTFYADVAKTAVNAGASVINDISAGNIDKNMISTIAALQVPYVVMHMQGTPQTMQQHPEYADVVKEVLDFFIAKISECRKAGVKDVIIDPGFGFGKTAAHNFELLKNMKLLKMTGCPVLAGLSRKSMIYKTLDITASDALNGTTVLNTIALLNGAGILRVHDVKEAKEAISLVEAMVNSE